MSIPIPLCRICGNAELLPVLSLGLMPPVNSFLLGKAEIAAEKKHPLAIRSAPTCS